MMRYKKARCATIGSGKTIGIGARVQLQIFGALTEGGGREPDRWGPTVEVRGIHIQGYDGTILTTVPAPNPAYPHHFSGRAKHFRLADG